MAAPTIREIRAGFGDRLRTIAGLRVHDTVPGSFAPPAAIVGMPRRTDQETMGSGTDSYECDIWVVVARQADAGSERIIEKYLNATGDESVRAAVYGGTVPRSLDGVLARNAVHELEAAPTSFLFGSEGAEVHYIGLEFRFEFIADGKD